ncbi:MAG: hypothetical protein PQJ46_00680 [Spirochaetales bacterium]|nr:hypothetical protein [Spirochaetales bacterium]
MVVSEEGLGWEDDHSTDFDLSAFGMGTVSAEDMDAMKMLDILKIYGTAVGMKEYENNPEEFNFAEVLGADTVYNFIHGTDNFVAASLVAKAMMNNPSQKNLDALNKALLGVQGSGLLSEHGINIDTTGLIGNGTDTNPYAAARARADGTIKVTGWAENRWVNDELYNALYKSEVKNGDHTQEWLDENYPLGDFAKSIHNGGDIVGSGDVIAQVAGALSMGYTNGYGLSSFITSRMNASTGYFSAHMDSESVMDYISLVATQGTTLQNNGGSYSLDGVLAGMVLGKQGMTGTATGIHIHNELRQLNTLTNSWTKEPAEWNKVFRNDTTYNALVPDIWAERNTGYSTRDYFNPALWQNVYDDNQQFGNDYSNYNVFEFNYLKYAPDGYGLYY